MAENYIPSGRTSAVNKDGIVYQLQTEYVRHPHTRVVTTIFTQGQVLHKIEKEVSTAVTTIDEMHRVEDFIKGQHREISLIIKERGLPTKPADSEKKRFFSDSAPASRLKEVPGIERVYVVTKDGHIVGDKSTTTQFKKMFRHVFRELPEMLKVFTAVPGRENRREKGIYEVEPNRILLVSTGQEYYLILINPGSDYNNLATSINEILGMA